MTHINNERMKERLLKKKKELEMELAKHGKRDAAGEWTGASDEIKTNPADKNEVADQIEDLVTNIPLVEELEGHYRDVLSALERIEQGTYGTCEVGGEQIPLERLEANPAAKTCIAHAQ